MDGIIRIASAFPPEIRWTIRTEKIENVYTFNVDCSGGWSKPLTLVLQNHLGHSQTLTLPACPVRHMFFNLKPYIEIRPMPARETWKIPRNIFQTWKDNNGTDEMAAAQKSFKDQNGYSYICWNDNECHQFLRQAYGERYASAYAVLTPGAYRADFWRYCILYRFGGIYADAKMSVIRSLDEVLRSNDELILVKDVPATCLLNGFIACSPGHPLLKIAIDMCLERIESRAYGEDPLDVTGPHLFGKAFCKWRGVEEDTLTLSPGYMPGVQILGRSESYIVSPEGELLIQKEYPSYYKKDIDIRYHYPQLWGRKMIYADQLPKPTPNPIPPS